MLQPYSKQKITQQTLLYLPLAVEVHTSSSVTSSSVWKLFDHTMCSQNCQYIKNKPRQKKLGNMHSITVIPLQGLATELQLHSSYCAHL
jgi:predicted nucleic acid-binding Zn ribbon protein